MLSGADYPDPSLISGLGYGYGYGLIGGPGYGLMGEYYHTPVLSEEQKKEREEKQKQKDALINAKNALHRAIFDKPKVPTNETTEEPAVPHIELDRPLLSNFETLLQYAADHIDLFPIEEQKLLIEIADCSALKIKEPKNETNNTRYLDLANRVHPLATNNADKCFSERGHFWGNVGIWMLAVIMVPALVVGTIAATIGGFMVHAALGVAALWLGTAATIGAVYGFDKWLDRFENNHNKQNAYKNFVTVPTKDGGTRRANPSLFFPAKTEAPTTTNGVNLDSQKQPQPSQSTQLSQ